MDSYPMVVRCMRAQSDWDAFYACVTCSHEVIRGDDYAFDCGWCGTEAITPAYLVPKLVDGEIALEKHSWSGVYLE